MINWQTFWQRRSWVLAVAAIGVAGAMACSSNDYSGSKASPTPAAATQAPSPSGPAVIGSNGTNSSTNGGTLAVSVGKGAIGNFLTGPDGKTLYVFLKDAPNMSTCTGGCAQNWPPLLMKDGESVKAGPSATGTFGSIDTAAGKQVTYNGAPLYSFAADSQPGDTRGNLVSNVWFVARPESASTAVLGEVSAAGKTFLVGPNGMTLYVFAKDTDGVSNCSGQCSQNWPALTVPEGLEPTAVVAASGKLAVLSRDDNSRQVTYNAVPVYYYAGDKLPGDTSGDGVGGVWTLARP